MSTLKSFKEQGINGEDNQKEVSDSRNACDAMIHSEYSKASSDLQVVKVTDSSLKQGISDKSGDAHSAALNDSFYPKVAAESSEQEPRTAREENCSGQKFSNEKSLSKDPHTKAHVRKDVADLSQALLRTKKQDLPTSNDSNTSERDNCKRSPLSRLDAVQGTKNSQVEKTKQSSSAGEKCSSEQQDGPAVKSNISLSINTSLQGGPSGHTTEKTLQSGFQGFPSRDVRINKALLDAVVIQQAHQISQLERRRDKKRAKVERLSSAALLAESSIGLVPSGSAVASHGVLGASAPMLSSGSHALASAAQTHTSSLAAAMATIAGYSSPASATHHPPPFIGNVDVTSQTVPRMTAPPVPTPVAASTPADSADRKQSRYWTADEHQRFLAAIKTCGPKNYVQIAEIVGTRNAKQVRTHAQKFQKKLEREEKKRRSGLRMDSVDAAGPAVDAATVAAIAAAALPGPLTGTPNFANPSSSLSCIGPAHLLQLAQPTSAHSKQNLSHESKHQISINNSSMDGSSSTNDNSREHQPRQSRTTIRTDVDPTSAAAAAIAAEAAALGGRLYGSSTQRAASSVIGPSKIEDASQAKSAPDLLVHPVSSYQSEKVVKGNANKSLDGAIDSSSSSGEDSICGRISKGLTKNALESTVTRNGGDGSAVQERSRPSAVCGNRALDNTNSTTRPSSLPVASSNSVSSKSHSVKALESRTVETEPLHANSPSCIHGKEKSMHHSDDPATGRDYLRPKSPDKKTSPSFAARVNVIADQQKRKGAFPISSDDGLVQQIGDASHQEHNNNVLSPLVWGKRGAKRSRVSDRGSSMSDGFESSRICSDSLKTQRPSKSNSSIGEANDQHQKGRPGNEGEPVVIDQDPIEQRPD